MEYIVEELTHIFELYMIYRLVYSLCLCAVLVNLYDFFLKRSSEQNQITNLEREKEYYRERCKWLEHNLMEARTSQEKVEGETNDCVKEK